MNKKCIVFFFCLLICPFSFGQRCNSLKPNVPNIVCDCDYLDNSSGWSYTCNNIDDSYDMLFTLTYITDSIFTFECGANEAYYETLLQNLNFTMIHTIIFKSCPLPNASYGTLIFTNDMMHKLQELRIENTRGNRSFTAELFNSVSEILKVLILTNNGIKNLSEVMFNNFTNLQYLSLSDNQLKSLPENIFQHMHQLTVLEIANNCLEYFPEHLFKGLLQLKKLYLYKNKLKSLPNSLFKSLQSLEVLDLADNQLMTLQPNIFSGLSELKYIRLRGNWLRNVPKELFSYSITVKQIDLSSNKFMEPLPETLLHGLVKLELFKIEDCNISSVHKAFFKNSHNITHLEMQYNSLKTLPRNIFNNNILLKELNLNFNFINELSESLLANQKDLEKLSLFANNISVIPLNFFKRTHNLKTLVLGQNLLQSATQDMFRDLPSLESIDLSKNGLTYFKLDQNRKIKYIDLSHNKLLKMPDIVWYNHLKLENLNLQYNMLMSFSVPILYSTDKRKSPSINVAHNSIKNVDVNNILANDKEIQAFSSSNYEQYVETTISLYSNPFSCDCELYNFFKYLKQNEFSKKSAYFSMIQDLKCHDPLLYRNFAILDMKPNQFICGFTKNCSRPCHCYTRAEDNSNIVNCSNFQLKDLPNHIPYNTSILYFQKNLLNSMSGFNHFQWNNLTQIFLNDNQISSLYNWTIPPNLKYISFAVNYIQHLPDFIMNFMSKKDIFHINLSNNPWICNCSAKNFKKWLVEYYKFVEDANKILCASRQKQNSTLVRMSILTIPDDVICPNDVWPYRVHIITVATICAILALLLFIVSILYYRNKQTVIAYLYIHMHPFFICFFSEEDFDEGKMFDAFVAYGHDDSDVAIKLIEVLEPHFQLCIHERNWIAGNQISWNIFNSVHNSRRTILVISKQFLESMWFQVEFHTAYYQMLEDKINRLIIIVKGELPPRESLDKELLYLLSTKTYLIWDERWFWEKLRYAMPHKKQQALQSNVLALKDKPSREKIIKIDSQIAFLSENSNKDQQVITDRTQSFKHQ